LYKENEPKEIHPVLSAHKKHGLPSALLKNRAAVELALKARSDILAESFPVFNSLFGSVNGAR